MWQAVSVFVSVSFYVYENFQMRMGGVSHVRMIDEVTIKI